MYILTLLIQIGTHDTNGMGWLIPTIAMPIIWYLLSKNDENRKREIRELKERMIELEKLQREESKERREDVKHHAEELTNLKIEILKELRSLSVKVITHGK